MSYFPQGVLASLAGPSINGLGDSITAQPVYQPVNSPLAIVPAWTASTGYAVGQVVSNSGYQFRCAAAGISASSGGPSPSTSSITDGGVTWQSLPAQSSKDSFLGWAEAFSLGALMFDQTQGYDGTPFSLRKIIVTNGGTGYSSGDTITLASGASATLTVVGGVITAATVTNPGYTTQGFTATINTSTGSGAVLSLVGGGHGTFGTFGCTTADMVARLPDCVASTVQIFTVMGGRNDIPGNVPYTTITTNLRTCYETLMAAGRKVIAIPVLPSTVFSAAQSSLAMRVNRWIRAYCRGLPWANPLGYAQIALADCSGLMTDATNLTQFWPIGGTGGTAAAVTIDGSHPDTRGRMLIGAAIWQAAQRFVGPSPLSTARPVSASDGYDLTANPGGNYLEATPWTSSTGGIAVGTLRYNGANIYRATAVTTGITGTSGPSGTGSGLTDGGVTWAYVRPSGTSVFASGSTGTVTNPGGSTSITTTGCVLAGGYALVRTSGGATSAGTITGSVEAPWSDGHAGQRQVLSFNLTSGTTTESWQLRAMYAGYAASGILSSDLGTNQYYAEAELELSGIANLVGVNLCLVDATVGWYNYAGSTLSGSTYNRMSGAAGDVLVIPNNGKFMLRTTRTLLPINLVNFNLLLSLSFDPSATAATLTIKINHMGVFKAGVS